MWEKAYTTTRKTPAATIAWRWLPTKNEHGGRGHHTRHCCGPPWVSSVHRRNQVPALDLGSSSSTSLRLLDTTKKERERKEAVCGAKTAGFKTTGFEPPNPVSETELPTSGCGAATVHRRRGFGGTHPHHRGKHGWKLYQAGSHENCLAQNSFSVSSV